MLRQNPAAEVHLSLSQPMLSDAQYFRGSASTVLTDSRYRLIDIFATPTCHHFQLSNYDPILRLQLTFLLLFSVFVNWNNTDVAAVLVGGHVCGLIVDVVGGLE